MATRICDIRVLALPTGAGLNFFWRTHVPPAGVFCFAIARFRKTFVVGYVITSLRDFLQLLASAFSLYGLTCISSHQRWRTKRFQMRDHPTAPSDRS